MAEALNVLRDAKSVILGVTKPALSLRTLFNIGTAPLERTVGRVIRGRLVANPALRNVQMLVRKLRKLPVKHRSSGRPGAKLSEVKSMKDLLPEIGLENLDVGSKKIDILYSSASTQDKLEFYLSIVQHLIAVGELGPLIDGVDEAARSDDEDSDDEEEGIEASEAPALDELVDPGSPIRLESQAPPAPVDELKVRAYAKVILNMEKIRLKITKIPDLMDEDAKQRSKATFSQRQIKAMNDLDTDFYFAMKTFVTPFFKAFTVEQYRVALKIGFRTKDNELFRVAVFNHYYPDMIHSPVTRHMITHDYTLCVAWLGMWRRMKDENIERNEAELEELRREAIASLKPDEEVERELPDELRALRRSSLSSSRSLEERLDLECFMCLHIIPPLEQVITDACQHFFCLKCIKIYMEHRRFVEFASCPTCTKDIRCWMTRADYKYAKEKLTVSGALKKEIPPQYFKCVYAPQIYNPKTRRPPAGN